MIPFATKGLPERCWGATVDEVVGMDLRLDRGDLPLPVVVVERSAVDHNIAVMQGWCEDHGVELAPHTKTALAPALLERQLFAGAWGATVSNGRQAKVAVRGGAARLIVASEVVDRHELRLLAEIAAANGVSVHVFVDSQTGLDLLGTAASAAGTRLGALIEIGLPGGRSGVRDEDHLRHLLVAAQASEHVGSVGVALFEGIVVGRAEMAHMVGRAAAMIADLVAEGILEADAILTAGGSIGFDLAAEALTGLGRIVLRSGCYLVHDHGLYAGSSPLRSSVSPDASLRPALTLWAHVLSTPEAGLAIVSFGRRDANEEAGAPRPLSVLRADGTRSDATGWAVRTLWDQHAVLARQDADAVDLAVAERVCFGISHPCTVFDKWRWIPEVDGHGRVVDLVETMF